MDSLIQSTIENGIGTISLDNYKKRNSLSIDLVGQVLALSTTCRKQK